MARFRSGEEVMVFAFDQISASTLRVELRFENLTPPVQSFAARVFVDTPHPNALTPTESNPNYLGTQFFYGLGTEAEHPLDYSTAATPAKTTEVRLNITQRVQAYLAHTIPHLAAISVVTVDRHGIEIANPDLNCERFSIITR